jgi:hypothetical protein
MNQRAALMAAIGERLATIDTTNGYNTSLGLYLVYFRNVPVESDRASLVYRDTGHTSVQRLGNQHEKVLRVEVGAVLPSETPGETAALAYEDIVKAVGKDPSFGRKALNTELADDETASETGDRVYVRILVNLDITYRVDVWTV